ncbi:MAG: DUF3810 domain-containing protein [Ruminococcus sp.]|nr:DUF3810 domain-containing protein [Ruminococcus sp.]
MDNNAVNVTPKEPKKPFIQRLRESGCFSPFYVTVMLLFALSLVLYVLSRFITPLAEFLSRYPAHGIRFIMAKLTTWIPFSVAECIIILLPLLFVAYMVYAVRFIKHNTDGFGSKVLMPLVSIILIIGILFFSMFAPCYFRNPLSVNLGIEDAAVSGEELFETAVWLSAEIKNVTPDITFSASGESHMPCDYGTMATLINDAFDSYASGVDYISSFRSSPKPIALSEPMTYTHISGVYSFFTGEANINVNYPDFIVPFTMAHEMSHQRGIAREEEANMVAFLVCLNSNNPYVRYSGLSNVLSYVNSALYRADKELYKRFRNYYYPSELAKENSAYSLFFDKYRENVANNVTNAVNNSFLQSQGQSQGTKSYGLVVDLTVSYYKSLTQ